MKDDTKNNNPLAEVFGFPIINNTSKALRYRVEKLCPYNNKVPNCTKDKANSPLGVCSIFHGENPTITCPTRFREDWIIVENAAKFAFKEKTQWTSLSEIRLLDKNGLSAGNIDFVLVAYNEKGHLIDFTSLEVQGVYISGNLRNPFDTYMAAPSSEFNWQMSYNYPKPDYLSSSRKRLIPQMLYKGGIFNSWGKKQTVALQKSFFDTLPELPTVKKEKADIAWFLYDLILDLKSQQFNLTLVDTVYTEFAPALLKVTNPEPGDISEFMNLLQSRLDERLDGNPPDAPSLTDIVNS
ncbi:MAG: NotI family restriction endonuclease [Ignavibacteriaceae bacterium]|nr:NotI family restriction endonuclease [Ignavibacteriaceae bacterium]